MCLHAQIEYFLHKLTEAIGGSWVEERFEDYKLQLNSNQESLKAWQLISLVGSGHFSKGMDRQTLSMGITDVYQELILDVLKQVGSTHVQTEHWYSLCDWSFAKLHLFSRYAWWALCSHAPQMQFATGITGVDLPLKISCRIKPM